jgi:S1/P1 Nuclease
MKPAFFVGLVLCGISAPVFAWGNKGHETVAYIAYQKLDDAVRKRVDDLVALNPCLTEWKTQVSSLAPKDQTAALFMLAATWPDKIKSNSYDCQKGHKFIVDGAIPPGGDKVSANVPPDTLEASQNIGYGDTRRHQYWHFIDVPFSNDKTAVDPTPWPNALTEIILLTKALHSDEGDDLKSYDMVWLEHLVGDVHQPLHDVSRFTADHPHGDQGGNLVAICETSGCSQELHGFWDGLPGSGDLQSAITLANDLIQNLPTPDDAALNVDNPSAWISDGFQKAKDIAYAAPVTPDTAGSTPHKLDDAYTGRAKDTMRSQVLMAGCRLAVLLKNSMQ